jgi:ligand-binding sensor domain-containing protein
MAQHINFKNITVADGLPQSQVFDIEQDKNGALWLATQGGGVCIYDGKTFEILDTKTDLPSSYVHTLAYYHENMFIGTDRGLVKIIDDVLVKIPSPGIRKINALEIKNDTLFIGTQNGLFYTLGKEISRYHPLPVKGQSINKILFSKGGIILSGIKNSHHYNGNNKVIHELINEKSPLITDFIVTEKDSYIATYNLGLYILNQENTFDVILSDRKIMDLMLDSDSNLWIGTQVHGVYKYDLQSKSLENLTTADGLANDHIRSIKQDLWGNVWIGTSGGGVSRYSGSQFLHYNRASGLNGNYIYSVLNDSRNNLWVGTSGLGIYRRNDTLEVVYNQKNGFSDSKVKTIFEDSRGLIWFGTEGDGFATYYGAIGFDTIIHTPKSRSLQSSWIKSFSEDRRGNVWIATAGGGIYKTSVYKKDSLPKISLSKIRMKNGELSTRFNKIIHRNDLLYLATADQGIGIIDGKMLDLVQLKNGLNSNAIRSIETDTENRLWYISDQGLGYYSNKKIVNFGVKDGLASSNCYQLMIDKRGAIWVGSERGLDQIYLVNEDSISVKHFGFREGFKGVETTLNACYEDASQRLWFGSVNGLSVFAPRKKMTNDNPPILRLKKYNLFYQSIFDTPYGDHKGLSDTILLPYDENSISFEFDAVFLNDPQSVNYQYKLFLDERSLPQFNNLSAVQYSNLEPGDYRLEVRAYRQDFYSQPIIIHFKIKLPYWRTSIFILSCVVGGLLMFALTIWLIYRRVQKKLADEKSKLEIERNLAELEQKALRLQMNPHFLFNILNSVQYLIQENDQQKARYALGKFAKLMRQILENSREKLISIDDELSTIQNYIALEKLTTSTDFDFEVDIEDELDTLEEILPPLMIQPFVENAIIHAFKGLNRKAQITISFKETEEYIEIEVRDNGIGREQAKLNRAQVETYHKSQALNVTQERLSNLNDDQNFKGFEIKDHFKDGKPFGTSVFLRLKN